MYEYENKLIDNMEDLKKVCRKATSYFVGSFILELIMCRKEWENPETKLAFVKRFHNDYNVDGNIERTRNRINCVIRIIKSRMVEEALMYVINANDSKMTVPEAKENAIITLKQIRSGKLKY